MNRIRILVEGQTERAFVNKILSPYFYSCGVYLHALMFRRTGGICSYDRAKEIIKDSLKEDTSLVCTTMVDYYALPTEWPGRTQANRCMDYKDKAGTVEKAILEDITKQMGNTWNPVQFIPYVQMHEFEALLFSSPDKLAESLGYMNLAADFLAIRNEFATPEEINDNYDTCPSRRIENKFQDFKKIADGITAANNIGLEIMRLECPHFNEWIEKLERIGK